jgi:HPt (histidine-containing phosphotransfer) domain-containing protein
MTEKGYRYPQAAVNLTDLLARVENDRELMRELIGIFKEDFPYLLQSLQESVARQDVKKVQDTSHALKGMLSGLSVMQAAATASRLEQMAREGNTSGLTVALALLESQVAQLFPELDAYAEEAQS